jgi:hypothetical protein
MSLEGKRTMRLGAQRHCGNFSGESFRFALHFLAENYRDPILEATGSCLGSSLIS